MPVIAAVPIGHCLFYESKKSLAEKSLMVECCCVCCKRSLNLSQHFLEAHLREGPVLDCPLTKKEIVRFHHQSDSIWGWMGGKHECYHCAGHPPVRCATVFEPGTPSVDCVRRTVNSHCRQLFIESSENSCFISSFILFATKLNNSRQNKIISLNIFIQFSYFEASP